MISQGWPQEKQYVDVKDRDNGWIVGLVLSKTENHIKIRGQGWSSKYDETLPYSPSIYLQRNSRIQPFRTYTRGYTGNKKSAGIREHWKSTALDIQNRLLILQGFISNAKSKTVRELTQFIRGEHYFYIDFLMGSTFVKMQKVYQYFRKHIQLINSFIDNILEIGIGNFFPQNNRPEPAQKDFWQNGYSECYYEIFQPLIGMLNIFRIEDRDRSYNFQKNNEKVIKLTTGFDLHSQYILSELAIQGTIEKLKNLIIHAYQNCCQQNNVRLPFFFIYFLLKIFCLTGRGYNKKQKSQAGKLEERQLFQKLSSICTKEISQLTIEDLKKYLIDDEIDLVLMILKQYNIKIFPQDNIKWLQQIEFVQLNFYLKFIKSNNLDRKLRGLSKIKQQCENIHLLNQKLGIQGLKSAFADMLHQLQFQKILFEQNQHTEVLKKSIELVGLIYKVQIVDLNPLIYCWNQCINKQSVVVKQLQQQWADIGQKISLEEFQTFINVVHAYQVSQPEINTTSQYVGFYFKLIYNLTKNLSYLIKTKQNHPLLENFQKSTSEMIARAYLFLSSDCHQENRSYMIEVYSKIVINSSQCRSIVNNLFCGLVKQANFKITLSVLLEIYSSNEPYVCYVPENYFKLLLSCLRVLELSNIQLLTLLKLLTKIFLISRQNTRLYIIKNNDFKQMWQLFQKFPEQKRTVLYDWMAPHRKHQLEHKSNINPSFSLQLKNYILSQVFCEENFRNFDNINKKQMQLILQFFTQKNVREFKLEEKYYYSDLRVMYRLNSIELFKEGILWKIFQKSQNNEVVELLSKKLMHFYFFYNPSVAHNLKKGRIDEFLYKIKQFLQQAHLSNNKTIIFNCLTLLKKVIKLTREQTKLDGEINTNNVIIKINFSFQSKIQHIDVLYEDTIGRIKQKIAKHLGLRTSQIKMFNYKNEQLSFDTKDSPNYYFSDKSFKIVRVAKEQQTLTHFVLHFLKEELQITLIKLFEKQETSLQIYQVLEQLQLKQSYNIILKKINQIIDNYSWEIVPHRKFIISYYLIQLKILAKFIQYSSITEELLNTLNFNRLKTIMTYKIENHFQINFLLILTSFLNKAIKIEAFGSIKTVFENHCFGVMLQLINFATKNHCDQSQKEWIGKIQENCINFLESAVYPQSMFVHLFSNSYFYKILEFLYFVTGFQDIKSPLNKKIRAYFKQYKNSETKCVQTEIKVTIFYTKKFYSRVIASFLSKQLKNTKGKAQFFANLSQILSLISPQIFQNLIVRQNSGEPPFLTHVHFFIQKYSLNSELKGYVYLDDFIIDHLKLLKSIIQNRPELKDINLIKFILTSCIGLKENGNIEPYIRNSSIIIAAFQLIIEILKNNNNQKQFSFLIQALAPCQKSTFWREQGKWELSAHKQAKQKYCGLQNPGCICYMNSLLQQMFMIQEFRNGIFQLQIDPQTTKMEQEHQHSDNESQKEFPSILKALKQLFLELALTSENKIDPTNFASTIRTNDNQPLIRMNEQMDIDQFSSILFDKLEKQLQQIGSKNLVRELFGGVYLNQIVSAECPHKSQREQSFISISLDVKRNIHESLKSFVRIDVLDGDNKYYCQTCDKKVKALKCQTIKTFPPYIILCLKRFQFNYEIEAKIKINDYCEFSHQLRLKDFSTQDFNKSSMTEEDNETKQILNSDDSQFNYRLRGVVVHTGSADSGHYYSYIVDGDGDWFEFNDEEVSQFDHRKLPEQAFGGKGGQYDDCRIKNAYLLIYEREAKLAEKELQSFEKIVSIQQNRKTIELINKRNQQNMKFLLVFSDIYEDLVSQLYINFCSLQSQTRMEKFQNDWYQFFLNYYLMVQTRKEGKSSFFQFSSILQELIKSRNSIGQKYIEIFSNYSFIQQFILYNSNRQKCKMMTNILSTAIIQHIHFNPKKQITEYSILFKFFHIITIVLLLFPNISQVTDVIIKIYEYCFNFNRPILISIIKTYNFCSVFLDHLCVGIVSNKKKSEYCEKIQRIKESNHINYIIPIDCQGKRYSNCQTSLEWKFLRLSIEYFAVLASQNENTQYIEEIVSLLRKGLKLKSAQQVMVAIYESHNFTGVYSLYKVFKELDILHNLFDGLEKGMVAYDSFKLRPSMLLIIMFLNDEDNSTEQFDILVSVLENAYKHNEKYYLEADILNQWIIRFLAANPIFLKCFRERVGFTEMIISWLKKNYITSTQVTKKHKYPHSQKYLNQYYGIMVSSDAKDYENNNIRLKQIYQSVLKGIFDLKSKIIRLEEPFQPQKKVKYFDNKLCKWVNGVVISNKFGYLQIEIEGKAENKVFIMQDSQKIKIAVPSSQEISCLQQVNSDCSYEQSGESEQS